MLQELIPNFGQKLRPKDYASFYVERLEESEEGEKPGFSNISLSEAVGAW